MNCQEVNELLVTYLDGEVTPSERKMIEAHLVECAFCEKEMDCLATTQRRLSKSLQGMAADAAPSPQAWSRLQARLAKEALRKTWPQRLAPGVWQTLKTVRGGEILMKHKFALAAVATLVLALGVVAFVPPVRAQVGEFLNTWFRFETPGGRYGVVLSGPAEFTPLRPTYLPAEFQSSGGGISVATRGESECIGLTYQNDDQFVVITQTGPQADKALPAGREITVNGQPAVLVTGLEGTFRFGPCIPERGQVVVIGTPPAEFPHHESIAYTDGKQLTWYAGDVKIEMLSNLSEEEMLKIAESMVPVEAGEGEPPFQPPLNLPSGGEETVIEDEGGVIQEGPIESKP